MRTTDEIYESLCSAFSGESGAAVIEGGDLSLRLRAVAAEVCTLEAHAQFVRRQSFPQTATGGYLDMHAEVRGLLRRGAEKARGALRFYVETPASAALSVPAGTRCMTAGGVAFVTTEAGVIAAGERGCTVAAEAENAGSGGNAPRGAVSFAVLPPAGVSGVVNDAAFSGGRDKESDGALRERVMGSYRTLPNGANAAYYESRVRSVGDVEAVTVLPKKRGLGTVDVVFTVAGGVPDAEKVAEVKALLEGEREICVDIAVSAPETAAVDVAAAVTAAAGYGAAAVKAAVEEAVTAYFGGALLGMAVYRARLAAVVMGVPGVENCVLSAPAADLAAAEGVLPVLGTLTVTAAGGDSA